MDVEGAAHGQRWRLNLPTPKASLVQSSPSHPGHTTRKGNAQNMRLGGAEPPDEEHLPAWLPQKVPSITHPSTFLDAAAQPRASREFKATGSSALGGNTKETGIAKIGDLSRRSLVHTMIRAWSCHQQAPAPGTLPHCLPITDHRAGAAQSRKEPSFGSQSLRASTAKSLCKESHPYLSRKGAVTRQANPCRQGPYPFHFSPTSSGYHTLTQPPSIATGGALTLPIAHSRGTGGTLTVTHRCPLSPGGRPRAGALPTAPPAPREKEQAWICPHAQTPMMMQAERWTGMSGGTPQGTPACPPQAIRPRCICPISSKPAPIRGPAERRGTNEEELPGWHPANSGAPIQTQSCHPSRTPREQARRDPSKGTPALPSVLGDTQKVCWGNPTASKPSFSLRQH